MALPLSVPERVALPKDLEVRPKQLKAWIAALPLAQSVEAGRKILEHVSAVNRAKLDGEERLQVMQVYAPTAQVIFEELDAIYSRSTIPLGTRARDALGLARSLASELGLGYKIVIAEKTGKLFGSKKQLPLLLYRAMEHVALGLRAAYKSYTPVPEGVWKQLHELYLYADGEGVADEPADPDSKASVGDIYCECLLLSLTDPYRLASGEADRVVAQVRTGRGVIALAQDRPSTPPSAHFLVPCDLDRPPKPLLSANDDRGGPNWRLLDANGLVDKLRMRRQAFETGNVSATTVKAMGPDALALLSKVITLWGDPPKRASRRDPMDTMVAVCVGIKSVSHYVKLEHKVDPQQEADAIRRGITIPLVTYPDDEASKAFPVTEFEVVNQSAGGIKVRRSSPSQTPIGVGEVVGVKLMGRARWTIGVARWITVMEDGGLEFGVQFLAPAARVVSIQPTITSLANQAKLALLLHDADVEAGSESLLTAPNTYSDLREFEVEEDCMVTCVRATSLVEKTPRFELFEISPS